MHRKSIGFVASGPGPRKFIRLVKNPTYATPTYATPTYATPTYASLTVLAMSYCDDVTCGTKNYSHD